MRAPLVGIASLAAIVSYCFYRGQSAKSAQSAKADVKEDVRRWESEGGNVPAVATPAPAPVPQSSFPASASESRH
jgi:hypothetical protein